MNLQFPKITYKVSENFRLALSRSLEAFLVYMLRELPAIRGPNCQLHQQWVQIADNRRGNCAKFKNRSASSKYLPMSPESRLLAASSDNPQAPLN
jgi:hypothetical protein